MKKKIHKLSTESNNKLIGIVSHLSIHQISWLLKQNFNMPFYATESLKIINKNKEAVDFSTYICEYSKDLLYILFGNKSNNEILIKSNKSIDYILKCSGNFSQDTFLNLLKQIRNLNNIITAFEIDISELRKSEQQLFS